LRWALGGVSSKRLSPQRQSPDLADRQKRSGILGIPRGHAPPWLEGQKGVLHPMPPRIPLRVIGAGLLAVAARRDHRDHPLRPGGFHHRIAVIASVRYEILRLQTRHQVHGLGTICLGPRGQCHPDGPPLRVRGPMQLGIQPPFVRALCGLPPCAPAAWGWTLIWQASIIHAAQSGSSCTASHRAAPTPRSHHRLKRRCVFFQSP